MNLKTLSLLVLCACGAGAPDPIELSMQFDVGPSSQALMCQTFKNPTGADVDIASWTTTLSNAGHHVLVFLVENPEDTAPTECAATLPGQLIFQSQTTGETTITYPAGAAAQLKAGQGLLVRVHYLNESPTNGAHIDNRLRLTLAPPSSVRDRVKPMMLDNLQILIPAQVPSYRIEKTCKVAHDLELVAAAGHMHAHGLELEAVAGSKGQIYDTLNWHQPEMKVFDPPLKLTAGDTVTFACTYRSEPDRDLHFGDRIETDEMCSLVGSYIPRETTDPGVWTCEPPKPAGACLSCFAALTSGHPEQACVDTGSAMKLAALSACTCGAGPCASACAASACAAGGGRPDDACQECQRTSCASEGQACITDQ